MIETVPDLRNRCVLLTLFNAFLLSKDDFFLETSFLHPDTFIFETSSVASAFSFQSNFCVGFGRDNASDRIDFLRKDAEILMTVPCHNFDPEDGDFEALASDLLENFCRKVDDDFKPAAEVSVWGEGNSLHFPSFSFNSIKDEIYAPFLSLTDEIIIKHLQESFNVTGEEVQALLEVISLRSLSWDGFEFPDLVLPQEIFNVLFFSCESETLTECENLFNSLNISFP